MVYLGLNKGMASKEDIARTAAIDSFVFQYLSRKQDGYYMDVFTKQPIPESWGTDLESYYLERLDEESPNHYPAGIDYSQKDFYTYEYFTRVIKLAEQKSNETAYLHPITREIVPLKEGEDLQGSVVRTTRKLLNEAYETHRSVPKIPFRKEWVALLFQPSAPSVPVKQTPSPVLVDTRTLQVEAQKKDDVGEQAMDTTREQAMDTTGEQKMDDAGEILETKPLEETAVSFQAPSAELPGAIGTSSFEKRENPAGDGTPHPEDVVTKTSEEPTIHVPPPPVDSSHIDLSSAEENVHLLHENVRDSVEATDPSSDIPLASNFVYPATLPSKKRRNPETIQEIRNLRQKLRSAFSPSDKVFYILKLRKYLRMVQRLRKMALIHQGLKKEVTFIQFHTKDHASVNHPFFKHLQNKALHAMNERLILNSRVLQSRKDLFQPKTSSVSRQRPRANVSLG